MRSLLIVNLATVNMQREGQELANLLGEAGYRVTTLQTNINTMELYRLASKSSIELVWLVSHSAAEGFAFGETTIPPREMGLFLHQAQTVDLVLNACYSAEHVQAIQRLANVNVLAAITQNLADIDALTSALYLARSLATGHSLRDAYTQTLSGGSDYRWFPAPRTVKQPMDNSRDIEQKLDKLEDDVEKILLAIQGNKDFGQVGIIERLTLVERSIAVNRSIVITRTWAIVAVVMFLLLGIGVIYLTYTFGGYHAVHINEFPLSGAIRRMFAGGG